jgi:tetratricopeptide (TPR) repeat protein
VKGGFEQLFREDHAKTIVGGEEEDTLMSLNNIGALLSDMKDYEGALDYYQQALRVQEKVLGKTHPDTLKQIKDKINKYAFSGGGATLEEHKEHGANLEVDVPYQWLRFFLEEDDRLAKIAEEYGSGKMMTGDIKKELINVLQAYVAGF